MERLAHRWSSFAVLAALALLGACATPTPYRMSIDSGPGYREQRIEEDRFRVTFEGNAATPRETVEIYLLYRAAQLTLAHGYDHFVVVERQTDADVYHDVDGTTSYGLYPYGPHGSDLRRFPYQVSGWPHGASHSVSVEYEATAEIVMRHGPPGRDRSAYDAREVVQNLGAEVAGR